MSGARILDTIETSPYWVLAQLRNAVYVVHVPNPQWITTTAASQNSGVPKRTIIAAITRGDLPAAKLPGLTGAYLIDPEELEIWLAGRTTAARA